MTPPAVKVFPAPTTTVLLYAPAQPVALAQFTLDLAPSMSTEKVEPALCTTELVATIVPGPSPGVLPPEPSTSTGTLTVPTPTDEFAGQDDQYRRSRSPGRALRRRGPRR